MEKEQILREFSADPDRYYKVALFEEKGFERRACAKCGRHFWTLDPGRDMCPDDEDSKYSFIGSPPTTKRFDYAQAWRQVESYFVENGHTSVSRYPVVCRWRDDLYFTIASIVDFQRVMGSKVVFEFPANPLVVPQTCLRFKDLENVGVTGRHFSSFCMIGQHSIAGSGGYWKDRCIELDFGLLTGRFGIAPEEVVFVEDVWSGGGSFGSSLEYFVRGLELGNAVFTEFQGELGRHTALDQKIIDMGAGLERFAWITAGTPTAYDCCFGPVTGMLLEKAGADPDSEALGRYFAAVAKELDSAGDPAEARRRAIRAAGMTDHQAGSLIAPAEGAYLIADHVRTLLFAISDGALPSNVGGGYNLRMMLRRIAGTAGRLGIGIDMAELVDAHVDYLRGTYPELHERREDVKRILEIESARYGQSRERMGGIASRMKESGREPTVDELITLYESDGITPDYLREEGAIADVPPAFYSRLSELHQPPPKKGAESLGLDNLPETEAMFYGEDPHEFEARVLRVSGDLVVLDRTSFYARGGGQEPDHGTIGGLRVTDVQKHAGVIAHRTEGGVPEEGSTVRCAIDGGRRAAITKNHTSTHVINAAARGALGSWVWQHSAFKDADHARLDITHHSALTPEQAQAIEDGANEMVRQDLPVTIQELGRGEAEQRYGFSIYQGGVVPVSRVRVVSVGDRDTEACGGTHVGSTGQIGGIRITRTKRIQDGVVRIEFVSGKSAEEHDKKRSEGREAGEQAQKDRERVLELRQEKRSRSVRDMPTLLEHALSGSGMKNGIEADHARALACTDSYDEKLHISLGKKAVAADPKAAYCAVFEENQTVRVIAYCGPESGMRADEVAGRVSGILGGKGGGSGAFAQGGGKDRSKRAEAEAAARSMILGR